MEMPIPKVNKNPNHAEDAALALRIHNEVFRGYEMRELDNGYGFHYWRKMVWNEAEEHRDDLLAAASGSPVRDQMRQVLEAYRATQMSVIIKFDLHAAQLAHEWKVSAARVSSRLLAILAEAAKGEASEGAGAAQEEEEDSQTRIARLRSERERIDMEIEELEAQGSEDGVGEAGS